MANNNGNKVLNAPPLRFPEFSGEWEKTTLGNVGKGFDYGMNAPAKPYDEINKYIRITDIDEKQGCYSDSDVVSPEGNLSESYVVKENDILLARTGASTGKSYLYNKKDRRLYFAGFLIRVNIDKENPKFIYTQLHTTRYYKWVKIMSARSGQPGINSQEYSSFPIYLPNGDEQNKIASLISRLDARIATQIGLIEDLKKLKSAINDMYHDNCEGERISFSEIGKSYSGLSGKSGEDFGNGAPFITYMNVYENDVVDETMVDYVRIGEREKQNKVSYGDLLFSLSSETSEEVGIGAVYLGESEKYFLNSFCFGVHINAIDRVHPPYLAYLVSSTRFRKFVYPLAQGSTRFNLQKNDFMRKKFILPKVKEQKRIARTLDSIAAKLWVEEKLLEAFMMQRQYLLRMMFV